MAREERFTGEVAPEEAVYWNPLDPAVHADPYPSYRRLRESAPMLRAPMGFWVVSRYADIAAVLRDGRFGHSMDEASAMLQAMEGPGGTTVTELSRWMLFRDPPDHTRLRALVSKAFTPRAVEALRPRVTQIVDQLVEGMLVQLREGGVVDLVTELALPLPVKVICELLGLPLEYQVRTRQWAEAIARALDPIVSEEEAKASDEAVTGLTGYLASVVEERRRQPGQDLLTRLIQAEDEGGHLSEPELISTVALLFGAGHETTRNLIGNGMLALLNHPDQADRLAREPQLIRGAIEELLRYDSPVQLAGRVAKADLEVGGEPIANGEFLVLLIGAGNRDPAQFPEPDRLDIARPDLRMLSFGGGIHFCLGAMLARMEAQIAFGTLIAKMPSLELATDTLAWRPHTTLRGLDSLPVKAGPPRMTV